MEEIAKPNPRKIFDELPAAIYVTDAKGRLTYFNREAARLSIGEPELGSDYWWDNWKFYRPDGTPISRGQWPCMGSKGERKQEERKFIAKRPDGTRVYLEVFTSSLRNDEGKTTGRILMLVDTAAKEKDAVDLSRKKSFADYEKDELANARLGAIINGSEDAIISKDLEGIITTWNEAAERMFGYTEEEAVGHPITILFPEDLIEEEVEILKQLRRGNRIKHYETTRLHKNGTPLEVSLSISPIRDASGNIVGASKIARDISVRKRAERERERLLREVETERQRLADIFKRAPSFMCVLRGPEHVFERANDLYYELIGKRDIIGKPVLKALPEVKGQGFTQILDEVYETGETYSAKNVPIELDRRPGTGRKCERRYLNYVYQPLHEPDGSVSGIFVQGLDITERKRAEKALRESEEKYRTLFESMDEGYCIIEMIFDEDENPVDYFFKEVNPAFKQHTGLENVEGKTMREIIPNPDDRWVEIYGKVAKTREPIRLEQSSKSLGRVLELYAYPFGEPQEQKIAVLFKDITERKRSQQKLQQMNETLEEQVEKRTASLKSYQQQLRLLAAELSKTEERERQRLATDLHDNMGQILAVSKMKLESLGRQTGTEEIEQSVQELKTIIDQAIAYSRKLVTDLKPPPSLNTEDLKENMSWLAQKMKKFELDVTVEDDGIPKKLSEEVQTTVFQCARELLFNVVKHAGINCARIILTKSDGFVRIVVKDEGKGFVMAEKQPVPTEEGGFGLFSIRERLHVLGGNLKVITQPGEGTRVLMQVPIKNEQDSGPEEFAQDNGDLSPQELDEQAEAQKIIEVLIVDDHRMMRDGLRKLIEDEQDMVVVAEAPDGEEAVEKAREHHPDVIVMDVNLPGLNGIEATRKVVADNPDVRVIGLSFHKEDSVAEAMHRAGASAYLTKSDVFETLCATIRSEVRTIDEQPNGNHPD